MNFTCSMKSLLTINSPASVKMSPPLPVPKSYQSCFYHIHTERGRALIAVWRTYHNTLPLLRTGSYPNRARKSARDICLMASISVRSMRRVS